MASRSDKLFQKRRPNKQRDLIRRKSSLPERRRVLIVCEGEKTEPLYLKALVADLGLTTAEVEVCGKCDSAPVSVVKFGKKKFNSDPDFDLVFFVFDQDTHASYDDALRLIEEFQCQRKFNGKTIAAITSIPCFEIWFLLHFEPHTKPYVASGGKSPCKNLISVLKRNPAFKDYEKGGENYFEVLQGRLPQAKKNSAQALKQIQDAGSSAHHGNPTTLMHKLIDALENVAAEYKI